RSCRRGRARTPISPRTRRSSHQSPKPTHGRKFASGGRQNVDLGDSHRLCRISMARRAVSEGVLPTLTPAASRASFFACAVPDEPDTIAPAWPIVLPSGAVNPATYPTTGLGTWEAVHARARASHLH